MIDAPVLPRQRPVSPPALARPRLGFAGVGWIGRHRMEAIARSGLAAIEAIVDADITTAESAAENLPGAVLSSSFDSLLDRDLDGIVIATPSALHAKQAIACLESGKAVFCQKPLGRDGAETAVVIETAARVDRLLGVDLSYRHMRAAEAVRDLIQGGELGDIYAVEAVFHNAYGPDKSWFYDRALSGGGCLLDLGIHLVDLGFWCLDFPAVTSAHGLIRNRHGRNSGLTTGVEDYATGQMELASGAVMRLACSWGAPAGRDAVIEWTFFGTRGAPSSATWPDPSTTSWRNATGRTARARCWPHRRTIGAGARRCAGWSAWGAPRLSTRRLGTWLPWPRLWTFSTDSGHVESLPAFPRAHDSGHHRRCLDLRA